MKTLQEKYRDLIGQAEEIRERHQEVDEWPADDLERFDKLMDRADELKGQIDRQFKMDEHLAWASEIPNPLPHPVETPIENTISVPRHYTKAFADWQAEYKPAQAEIEKTAGYTKAFDSWVRSGAKPEIKAALQEGAVAEGGYTVPTPMLAELVQAISTAGIMLPLARRLTMTRWKMDIPSLTASTRAVLTVEEDPYSEVEPTFGTVPFEAYKFTRLAKASDELLADSLFNIWGQVLSPDFANAFALAIDYYATTGTGSGEPEGVVTGAGTGVTAASATAITADEIFDLYHSLGYQYRGRATWMMNDATVKYIRVLKDTTNQYLWQPGLQAGQPDRLLGRPLVTNNNMATIAASAKTILFADLSFFWIGMREDISIKRLEELYAASGQVGFRAFHRWDSHVMLAAAFKLLVQKTA